MGNLCAVPRKEALPAEYDFQKDNHHYNSAMFKFKKREPINLKKDASYPFKGGDTEQKFDNAFVLAVQKYLGEFEYYQEKEEDDIKIEAKPMEELNGPYMGKKLQYTGEWSDKTIPLSDQFHRHGKGVQFWGDGLMYEGNWKES